ncbi:hypothetical protein C5167_049439, partial [Papaver somniferum]
MKGFCLWFHCGGGCERRGIDVAVEATVVKGMLTDFGEEMHYCGMHILATAEAQLPWILRWDVSVVVDHAYDAVVVQDLEQPLDFLSMDLILLVLCEWDP